MGLGLGIGLLVGARAATAGTIVVFLLVVFGLVLLALMCSHAMRLALLLVAAGCVVGWGGAELRSAGASHHVPVEPPPTFEATLASDPRATAAGSHTLVVWWDDEQKPHELDVYLPVGAEAERGDRVVIHGQVSDDGAASVVFAESLVVAQRANRLEQYRRTARRWSSSLMTHRVPGSPGNLTLGLLIGDDSGLSQQERANLRRSGLSHITAVSGWNVSIVVVTVGALFRALGTRRWRWVFVQLGLLTVYVWIVGLEPPIQRAAIMGAVALVALQLGRPAHMLTLLTLTAGVMATWNPAILNSLSFLLSFLAMVGLGVSARITSGLTGWRAALVSPAIAAGAAGIATAPLLAATMGTAAFMTVPANVIVAPLIPIATFAGIAVVAVAWVPPLAEVAGWLAWAVSAAVLRVAQIFAGVPYGHYTFAPLQPATVLTVYFALGLLAAPLIPEGRILVYRVEDWVRASPASGALAVIVFIGFLAIGLWSI